MTIITISDLHVSDSEFESLSPDEQESVRGGFRPPPSDGDNPIDLICNSGPGKPPIEPSVPPPR